MILCFDDDYLLFMIDVELLINQKTNLQEYFPRVLNATCEKKHSMLRSGTMSKVKKPLFQVVHVKSPHTL